MFKVALHWWRCPDGVEIYEKPDTRDAAKTLLHDGRGGPHLRYRSERIDPQTYQVDELQAPKSVEFVNSADIAKFFSVHGLPYMWNDWPVDVAESQRVELRSFLNVVGGADRVAALAAANKRLVDIPFRASLDFDPLTDRPAMTLRTNSLHNFMFLEGVLIAQQGARIVSCEHDGRLFTTGPMTGRRSHARYCSDRCRVAAMRARKALS